jgi:Fe/S biogenesis protein NfuA
MSQTDESTQASTDATVRITPAALAMVTEIRTKEENPDGLALWLEVNGTANGVYTYDLWFEARSEIGPDDAQQFEGDLPLVVPAASVDRLRGATLDVSGQGADAGLVILNPNTPPKLAAPAARAKGDLSGAVAQRILVVLEKDVNPQIAMHGGHADLVAVEGSVAFVEMSGGCQGCGMARATLSQGISVAIVEAVPEITEVVDVTDHASGDNPYYEPALG